MTSSWQEKVTFEENLDDTRRKNRSLHEESSTGIMTETLSPLPAFKDQLQNERSFHQLTGNSKSCASHLGFRLSPCEATRSLNIESKRTGNPRKIHGLQQIKNGISQASTRDSAEHMYSTNMVLNKGSIGTIFQVSSTSKKDALFVKKSVDTTKAAIRRRVQQELDIFRKLEDIYSTLSSAAHRVTVQLLECHEKPTEVNLILNYLPGGDLERFCSYSLNSLGMEVIRFCGAELVNAVEFLHKHHILHRDIKPENILIDARGHLVLADFDLAIDMLKEKELPNTLSGTLAYIAPEVAKRDTYSYPSDIFSLGMTLLWMANRNHFRSAKTAFHQLTTTELGQLARTGAYSLGSIIRRHPDVRDLITKLLMYPANERPSFEAIRDHAFFSGIDFNRVAKAEMKPPRILVPRAE